MQGLLVLGMQNDTYAACSDVIEKTKMFERFKLVLQASRDIGIPVVRSVSELALMCSPHGCVCRCRFGLLLILGKSTPTVSRMMIS